MSQEVPGAAASSFGFTSVDTWDHSLPVAAVWTVQWQRASLSLSLSVSLSPVFLTARSHREREGGDTHLYITTTHTHTHTHTHTEERESVCCGRGRRRGRFLPAASLFQLSVILLSLCVKVEPPESPWGPMCGVSAASGSDSQLWRGGRPAGGWRIYQLEWINTKSVEGNSAVSTWIHVSTMRIPASGEESVNAAQ